MISNRCKFTVKEVLKKHGLHFVMENLGEVDIMENLSAEIREEVRKDLHIEGFELMDDRKAIIIQQIRNTVIELVHHTKFTIKTNFSDHLSKKLNYNYTYLANLFSEIEGITIEQFIIFNKIERIKELIIYGELNMTEIARSMNYSSVAHLSNQFKKVTGLTPTHFKQIKEKRRLSVEEIGILKTSATNGDNDTSAHLKIK